MPGIGFNLEAYDSSQPLVIDPILSYSTYLGGGGSDSGRGIAVDSNGNIYVSGMTQSSNFPTRNPLQNANQGDDIFIAKLNATGSELIYSTYVGGSGHEGLNAEAHNTVVDGTGNVFVTGHTNSSNFPTQNALQPHYGGGNFDAFVLKLNAAGTALMYSTYLGGSAFESGRSIALDGSGNGYVVGVTSSRNFPVTSAFQPAYAGDSGDPLAGDAFVTKINPSGSALVYSTYPWRQ